MRVIAGVARSLKLKTPEGDMVRPTTDRTKETLFNMINNYVVGGQFLDIFSGSGSIGIEALSRGAKEATFIENNQKSLDCIEFNLRHTKLFDKVSIYKQDVLVSIDGLGRSGKKFDVIFLDPPYNKDYEEKTIGKILQSDILDEDGIIVCESASDTAFSFIDDIENVEIYKEKKFKTSKFSFIRYSE